MIPLPSRSRHLVPALLAALACAACTPSRSDDVGEPPSPAAEGTAAGAEVEPCGTLELVGRLAVHLDAGSVDWSRTRVALRTRADETVPVAWRPDVLVGEGGRFVATFTALRPAGSTRTCEDLWSALGRHTEAVGVLVEHPRFAERVEWIELRGETAWPTADRAARWDVGTLVLELR